MFENLQKIPPHAKLFMFDAVSIYTKIDTDHALEKNASFLRTHKLVAGLPTKVIISGLELIMC
jgi:hypothetical protein